MEAVKAHSIPKHTRGAAGPTGPRIDEKTPTALSPSPSTFHYCFSDQACDHILPHPPPHPVPQTHSQEASVENQITAHREVSVMCAKSSLQLRGARHCPRKTSPAEGSGQSCAPWGGQEQSQAALHQGQARRDTIPSHPSLGSPLPFPALSSCVKLKSLSHLQVQVANKEDSAPSELT